MKGIFERFIQEVPAKIKETMISKYKLLDTSGVRDLSKQLVESTIFDMMGVQGGNNSEISLKCTVKESDFFIPPNSRYYFRKFKN